MLEEAKKNLQEETDALKSRVESIQRISRFEISVIGKIWEQHKP